MLINKLVNVALTQAECKSCGVFTFFGIFDV